MSPIWSPELQAAVPAFINPQILVGKDPNYSPGDDLICQSSNKTQHHFCKLADVSGTRLKHVPVHPAAWLLIGQSSI